MPLVKCISGNLNSVSFVRFDFAEGIVIKILDKLWVNGTDEKICLGKLMGKDFVIMSCMLYYDLILSILVDTFISKISLPMQPVPEIGSISVA